MRWFNHRARLLLVVVIVFLALLVTVIGVVRMLDPELNLMEKIGFLDDEKPAIFKSKPYWNELTEKQREALLPLEREWDRISSARKKKWLEIARRMEGMSVEEKKRMQERIRVWLSLTPDERKEARQNYLSAKKLDVKDKSHQWVEYQNLSPDEKKRLTEIARKKRRDTEKSRPKEESPPVTIPGTPASEPVKESGPPAKEDSPDYWR